MAKGKKWPRAFNYMVPMETEPLGVVLKVTYKASYFTQSTEHMAGLSDVVACTDRNWEAIQRQR